MAGPWLVRNAPRWLSSAGQPAGLPGRHPGDHAAERLRRPGRREQRQVGQAAPQHQPERPGHVRPGEPASDEGCRPVTATGPQQDGEQRVDDHGARRAVSRAAGPVQDPAEALAEPPHAQRPHDRGAERELERRPPGDPEADRELDEREDRVRQRAMPGDDLGGPVDRVRDDRRVARRRRAEHLREALAEHEGLELQHRIEQPDARQHQLQPPPDIGGGPAFLMHHADAAQPSGPGPGVRRLACHACPSCAEPTPGRLGGSPISRLRCWQWHEVNSSRPDHTINMTIL